MYASYLVLDTKLDATYLTKYSIRAKKNTF